ncbi:hypothetical protein [Sphingobacterium zeae]|uniref:hypothetical protein n=1 Tax=Sphingobacterium zeae TaxID=1776859 RepID=UPI0027D8DEB2|nr:hypothetical protein [Sphingobacterium zeae]
MRSVISGKHFLISVYVTEQLTSPFEIAFDYVKADYQKPFVFYGIENDSSRMDRTGRCGLSSLFGAIVIYQ